MSETRETQSEVWDCGDPLRTELSADMHDQLGYLQDGYATRSLYAMHD